jgi:hypothetical protein
MANEFVLTPAAWLQPASLFTPTPKASGLKNRNRSMTAWCACT